MNRKLDIGAQVFIPGHGVALVRGLDERAFGRTAETFYVLAFPGGGTMLIPIANLDKVGVRDLVSAKKAKELLSKVATAPATTTKVPWRERLATYAADLRVGSPDRYTEILQELRFRSPGVALTASQKNLQHQARDYFVGEIAAALERPAREIAAVVDGHLAVAEGTPTSGARVSK